MENLLVNLLAEVIRHATHKCALREVGNLRGRYKEVQLSIDRGRCVLTVDRYRLTLLEYFAETLREVLCCSAYHLSAEDVTHRILDNLRLPATLVTSQLRVILTPETNSYLVASGSGNEVVDTAEIDSRQLVNDDGTLQLTFLVHQLHDTAVV